MIDTYDVVVIGAGPAGLLAAGRAAALGARVILIEKMEKPARKLRITGKGRCNITNVKTVDDYLNEISPDPNFLNQAFESFFHQNIIDLLNINGVETIVERGQRVFPKSGKAWDVAEGLIRWVKSKGVIISSFSQVLRIITSDNKVEGVELKNTKTGQKKSIHSKAIIIATGGKSYPLTGSTGDGYLFAQTVGHKTTELTPSLVGIETNPILYRAVGLKLKNVQVNLIVDNESIQVEFGELDIAEYGLEGPIILKISRNVVRSYIHRKNVTIFLDLKPALSKQKLENRLVREIEENPRGDFLLLLKKLLPNQLIPMVAKLVGIDLKMKLTALTSVNRSRVVEVLKSLEFNVTGYRGWDEAIVTAGGVATREINPLTMESKFVNGLYFAGEVLDVDGNTGGYNLQIAFSTGWLAGESATKSIQPI